MIAEGYLKLPYDTPEKYKNTYPNSRVLIISNGHSTRAILDKKKEIRDKFDCILLVNSGFKYFDDICDFHMICEKISPTSANRVYKDLNAGNYRTDVPRFFNWKGIENYDPKYNIHKLARNYFGGKPNLRTYCHNSQEGILIGPPSKRGLSLGSVTLSSMHLACILGAKEIYLIGADMMFKDDSDHFYQDRQYRDGQKHIKPENRNNIVTVQFQGKTYETTDYFRDSAKCIDDLIKNVFSKEVEVFDFSDGLIQAAKPLDVKEFLNG